MSNTEKRIAEQYPERAAQTVQELKKQILDCLYSAIDIDVAMNHVLKIVGEYFNVDRAYIFENSENDLFCKNTFEWCNKGIEPEIDKLQRLSYKEDLGGKWLDNFNRDDIFFCPSIRNLPMAQQVVLEPQHITSMLQCAIRVKGAFKGYIGFDNCSQENKGWETDSDAIDTLLYTSHLLTLYLLDYRREEHQLTLQEQKVRRAYELFDDLLCNITCGVAVYNVSPEGKITVEYINDGLAAMSGCSVEKLRTVADRNHVVTIKEEYQSEVRGAFRRILDGEKEASVTLTHLIFRRSKAEKLRLKARSAPAQPSECIWILSALKPALPRTSNGRKSISERTSHQRLPAKASCFARIIR